MPTTSQNNAITAVTSKATVLTPEQKDELREIAFNGTAANNGKPTDAGIAINPPAIAGYRPQPEDVETFRSHIGKPRSTPGEIYITWLQALEVGMADLLRYMSAEDLGKLRALRTKGTIAFIEDDDLMNHRDPDNHGLCGLISIPSADGKNRWSTIQPNDSRINAETRRAYVEHQLIPKICDNLVQIYRCNAGGFAGMTAGALHQLNRLIEDIEKSATA